MARACRIGATITTGLTAACTAATIARRTIRITRLPAERAEKARVAMLAATPKKTGRVTPTIESVPAED